VIAGPSLTVAKHETSTETVL